MSLGKKKMLHQAAAGGVVNTENFNTALYTGNGSTQSISVGFQPDAIWIKERGGTSNHQFKNSVAGDFAVFPNLTIAESATSILDFESNGFSFTGGDGSINNNNDTYVAWCWKAGGAAVSNTDGDITSSVSANQDAGFSIVKFTGTTETAPTVGHGLSSEPEIYFLKGLDNGTDSWIVSGNSTIFSSPTTNFLRLNTTDSVGSTIANQVGSNGNVINVGARNYNGQETIAYCFHSVDGYQKVGSYTGTGVAGLEVTTGFQPRFLMIKRTDSTGDWDLFITTLSEPTYLKANKSDSEATGDRIDVDTTSFTLKDNGGSRNASGGTYIYLAIA